MSRKPRRSNEKAAVPAAGAQAVRRERAGGASPPRPGTRRMLVAALAVAALAAGVLWLRGRRGVDRDPGLSVLLVTVDTLRADALGSYGNAAAATPWTDRLASGGLRFERAHAHNVITLPSHANILSGRLPLDHGVRDNAGFRFPRDVETLATILRRHGRRTAAFVSAFPLESRFGLDRGFDVYDDRFSGETSHTAFRMQERRGAETVAEAVKWLQAQGGAPVFCWVHLYEPHFPYEPPEPHRSRSPDPYHGEVSAADAALRPLLEPILDAGERGRTLVVLTSDHGEALGEHDEATHGIFAYEGTLRVPLIVYAPRLFDARVVKDAARHVDIAPTILDALGFSMPGGLPGRSLLAAGAGRPAPAADATYFESLAPSWSRGWAPLRGVVQRGMKYVDLPLPELYDLEADPGETRNLVAEQPVLLEELRGRLARLRAEDRGTRRSEESAETRERLRALGYVTAAASVEKERYTEEDDPKRLIALDTALQDVITLYRNGDLDAALRKAEGLVATRPMPVALTHLAFLYREKGALTAAVNAARRAFELNPLDTDVLSLYGNYLNEAGQAAEAARVLEPYAAREAPDLDVLTARGIALASLGRPAEAIAAFEAVRALDVSSAMALVNIGTVHLLQKRPDQARDAFEAALRLDPALARAHNSLGVIAAESGRPEEAIERWRRAVSLDPTDYETLFNLGVMLRRLGRDDQAREYLEKYVRVAPRGTESRDVAEVRRWLASGAPGR